MKCEAEGGDKIEFTDHILELWRKIGYSPEMFSCQRRPILIWMLYLQYLSKLEVLSLLLRQTLQIQRDLMEFQSNSFPKRLIMDILLSSSFRVDFLQKRQNLLLSITEVLLQSGTWRTASVSSSSQPSTTKDILIGNYSVMVQFLSPQRKLNLRQQHCLQTVPPTSKVTSLFLQLVRTLFLKLSNS